MRIVPVLCATLALLRPLAAQDTAIVIQPESVGLHFTPPELPGSVVSEAVRFYNARTTTRLAGRVRLPAGNAWRGDVAIRNGPALLGGRVEGSLVVLNGDAVLDSTAVVTGEVLVIGGTITGPRDSILGGARAYTEPLPYRLEGDSLVHAPDLWRRLSLSARYVFGRGEARSSLVLATGGTYNRVEGLPIVAGPSFDLALGSRVHLRFSAAGVFRTARSINRECCDLGYSARAEIRVGDRRPIALALRSFDLVTPVEDWGLRANEVGWEAFFVRRDYRDYFRNNGTAARLTWQTELPLALGLELRHEHQTSVGARDPWSLSRTSLPWRPNPAIDAGTFVTLTPSLTLDTRNNREQPSSGWLVRATVDVSHSDDMRPAAGFPTTIRDSAALLGDYSFTRGFFDVRRYNRLSSQGRLNLRLVLGGWLGGDPLPIHRRLSLGGPEPLPGYEFRQSACNAAANTGPFAGIGVAACDRVIVVQAEYRGHLSLRSRYNTERGEGEGLGYVTRFLRGPDFVVFGDAGQGWMVGSGPGRISAGRLPHLASWLADLGLGVDWGGFGLYVAKAVTVGQPLRLTARLDHRF